MTALTGEPFNTWERWRRERLNPKKRGVSHWLRTVYHRIITWLPVLVSVCMRGGAWQTGLTDARWYVAFGAVVAENASIFYYTWHTTRRIDRLWKDMLTRPARPELRADPDDSPTPAKKTRTR